MIATCFPIHRLFPKLFRASSSQNSRRCQANDDWWLIYPALITRKREYIRVAAWVVKKKKKKEKGEKDETKMLETKDGKWENGGRGGEI